jgi:hypothetical protein
MRIFAAIDASLAVVAVILAINLLLPAHVITGNTILNNAPPDARCYFNNSAKMNPVPIDMCCMGLQKQLYCVRYTDVGFNVKCYSSEKSGRYYLIDSSALSYCRSEGYDIEVKG